MKTPGSSRLVHLSATIGGLLLLMATTSPAQDDLTFGANPWTWNGSVSATVGQVSFTHWAAGGEFSYLLGLNSTISPQWSDSLWSFVGSWYGKYSVFKRKSEPARKVDDDLELSVKFGRMLFPSFHAVVFADLQSQFWPGYDFYMSSTAYTSNFMAPGYLTNGLGLDYRTNDQVLSIILSPFSSKETIVLDHGVDPTQYGVKKGKHVFGAPGAYSKITVNGKIIGSLSGNFRAILFKDYTRRVSPDLSFKGQLDYQLLSFLQLYFRLDLLNDDDINVNLYEDLDNDGSADDFAGVGPRLQVSTQLGIAVSVSF